MISSFITIVSFIIIFAYCVETNFENFYAIIGLLVILLVGFSAIIKYDRKIIGKKSAVDLEVERLKSLYPEEKLELPEIDQSELELREIIRNRNSQDMV